MSDQTTTTAQQLEAIARAIESVPSFGRLLYSAAWQQSCQERARRMSADDMTSRPTKRRERAKEDIARYHGIFFGTVEAIQLIAEGFGARPRLTLVIEEVEEIRADFEA